MLKLVLPKGSLEKATLELFADADLAVHRSSSVTYSATIDDPRIGSVRILRPQEIPTYVAEGLFDLGICGRDWVEETSSTVESLGELQYSKATSNPVRIVVAVPGDSPFESVADLPSGVRVSSEYPELTARFFAERGVDADIRLSYGATEAKVPDIVDCVVDITETGRALRAAGLKIIDTILVSYTELVANPEAAADPVKRHAMEQVMTLLQGVLEARGKVLAVFGCGGVPGRGIQRAGGQIKLRPGQGTAHHHVGADMLDRLKPANGPVELLAHLGIVRRHVAGAIGSAEHKGSGEQLQVLRGALILDRQADRGRAQMRETGGLVDGQAMCEIWREVINKRLSRTNAERQCGTIAIEQAHLVRSNHGQSGFGVVAMPSLCDRCRQQADGGKVPPQFGKDQRLGRKVERHAALRLRRADAGQAHRFQLLPQVGGPCPRCLDWHRLAAPVGGCGEERHLFVIGGQVHPWLLSATWAG